MSYSFKRELGVLYARSRNIWCAVSLHHKFKCAKFMHTKLQQPNCARLVSPVASYVVHSGEKTIHNCSGIVVSLNHLSIYHIP